MINNQPSNKHNTQPQPHDVDWDEKNIQRLWDFYGSSSDKDSVYFAATVGLHVARTIKRLGLLKNSAVIVDFSCGKGHLINYCSAYLKSTTKIIGYDPSEKSVAAANIRNKQLTNFGGAYHLTSLPSDTKDNFVDLVLLTEVIEHLDEKYLKSVLKECYRILKPGGKLFLTTPNNEQLEREKTMCPECCCIFHRWQHVRSWTPNQLKETLSQFGFKNTTTKTITWGNEWIDIAFSLLRKKKTGIYSIAIKPDIQ